MHLDGAGCSGWSSKERLGLILQGLWIHRKHEALKDHFGAIPEALYALGMVLNRLGFRLYSSLNLSFFTF